ncbi:hypothetical protein ACWG8W_06075 [Citricoccus zhacaiensis]
MPEMFDGPGSTAPRPLSLDELVDMSDSEREAYYRQFELVPVEKRPSMLSRLVRWFRRSR